MKSFSFCLSRTNFVFPSFMKDSFVIYSTLGWSFLLPALWIYYPILYWPAVFLLRILLITIPLYAMCLLSLAAVRIFPLSCFIVWLLRMLVNFSLGWIWLATSVFPRPECWCLSSYSGSFHCCFFNYVFWSLSLSKILIKQKLVVLIVSYNFYMCSSLLFSLFVPLIW